MNLETFLAIENHSTEIHCGPSIKCDGGLHSQFLQWFEVLTVFGKHVNTCTIALRILFHIQVM